MSTFSWSSTNILTSTPTYAVSPTVAMGKLSRLFSKSCTGFHPLSHTQPLLSCNQCIINFLSLLYYSHQDINNPYNLTTPKIFPLTSCDPPHFRRIVMYREPGTCFCHHVINDLGWLTSAHLCFSSIKHKGDNIGYLWHIPSQCTHWTRHKAERGCLRRVL